MKLLIIAKKESELSRLLAQSFEACTVCMPGALPKAKLGTYDAFAVLGGDAEEPLTLWQDEMLALEARLKQGARIFTEYTSGISTYHSSGSEKTRYARPVLLDNTPLGTTMQMGTLFDEQSNDRLIPNKLGRTMKPVLQYADNPKGFYCLPHPEEMAEDEKRFGLWFEKPNLLICTFRMQNFASAKFAPQHVWAELIRAVITWLGGTCSISQVMDMMQSVYHLKGTVEEPAAVAQKAAQWFIDAGMVVERQGSPYCVLEGTSAHVKPDGSHVVGYNIRPDCTGEASLMFYLKSLLENDPEALRLADGFRRLPADSIIPSGLYQGMVSWTPNAFFACYQDDVARGYLLPELWRAYLSGDHSQLGNVKLALDYLLSTTGTDGLRMCRTDYLDPEEDKLTYMSVVCSPEGKWSWSGSKGGTVTAKELRSMPANCPSAHYNGFYLEALMLYGKLTGETKYSKAGEKGITSLMSYYPQTAREHSQTQELCRLIQVLAVLYWVTEDAEKKQWLYQVTDDLCAFRHENGGYKEWDEGYIACCAGVADGESSVLSENGDPVADMLYSINWLPMGFAVAYLTTGDEKFKTLWREIAEFFSRMQIVSDDKLINGAWPRSIDLDTCEVYGVPNDVGWAPWSIESGWTVAEIAAGLLFGEICCREK